MVALLELLLVLQVRDRETDCDIDREADIDFEFRLDCDRECVVDRRFLDRAEDPPIRMDDMVRLACLPLCPRPLRSRRPSSTDVCRLGERRCCFSGEADRESEADELADELVLDRFTDEVSEGLRD